MINRIYFSKLIPTSGAYTPWLNCSNNESITIGLYTDVSGTIEIEFSEDEGFI